MKFNRIIRPNRTLALSWLTEPPPCWFVLAGGIALVLASCVVLPFLNELPPYLTDARTLAGGGPDDVGIPVIVDLDGTLLRTDMLVETAASYLARNPLGAGRLHE